MSREDFEVLVEEGYLAIPEHYRRKVQNVAFIVEDEPDMETRQHEGLADNETLFGLYTGIPLPLRGADYGSGMVVPDTIIIYQLPIEAEAQGNGELVRRIVADTVWHEVGHYLGLNESEVQAREEDRGIGHYRLHGRE